jgi:hypothetical protein
LLTRVQDARDKGEEVTITFDPIDGHPTKVTFNPSGAAVDAASCSTITDYVNGTYVR